MYAGCGKHILSLHRIPLLYVKKNGAAILFFPNIANLCEPPHTYISSVVPWFARKPNGAVGLFLVPPVEVTIAARVPSQKVLTVMEVYLE